MISNKVVSMPQPHIPRRYVYFSEYITIKDEIKQLKSEVKELKEKPKVSVNRTKEDWFGSDYIALSRMEHFQHSKTKKWLAEIIHSKHRDKSIKLIMNRMSEARRNPPV